MKLFRTLACGLALTIAQVSFASLANEYKVTYSGGSLSEFKNTGSARLSFSHAGLTLTKDKEAILQIPISSITEISYGQEVHRRIGTAAALAAVSLGVGAIVAFSKSKKHYVGVTWDDSGNKGGMILQADKDEYRGILTGLEGLTGKKAVDADKDKK
jgi:hypothetical protein